MDKEKVVEPKPKSYVCRSCKDEKKLGTNFKYVVSWWSNKFQDFDEKVEWDQTLCSPCGEGMHKS